MNKITILVACCLLLCNSQSYGQAKYKFFDIKPNKGKFFLSLGWNRGYFSNSELHCKGDDYEFTLHQLGIFMSTLND